MNKVLSSIEFGTLVAWSPRKKFGTVDTESGEKVNIYQHQCTRIVRSKDGPIFGHRYDNRFPRIGDKVVFVRNPEVEPGQLPAALHWNLQRFYDTVKVDMASEAANAERHAIATARSAGMKTQSEIDREREERELLDLAKSVGGRNSREANGGDRKPRPAEYVRERYRTRAW